MVVRNDFCNLIDNAKKVTAFSFTLKMMPQLGIMFWLFASFAGFENKYFLKNVSI
jgi:hypothetical protein